MRFRELSRPSFIHNRQNHLGSATTIHLKQIYIYILKRKNLDSNLDAGLKLTFN
jgi:hypothetical protein